MNETDFWAIVDRCARVSRGSFARRVELLREELLALPAEGILSFQELLDEFVVRADTVPLMDAATLIGGGCSDDGFVDFRSWLISAGQCVYLRALKEPDSLADVEFGEGGEEDCFFEEFNYVAGRAYEEITGHEMPRRDESLEEVLGRRRRSELTEVEPSFLPRLRKKYAL